MDAASIVHAAEGLGVSVRELPRPECEGLLERAYHFHVTPPRPLRPPWHLIAGGVSTRDPDAWKWIESFPAKGSLVLAVMDHDRWSAVEFQAASDLVAVLGETPGFEFLVVEDPETAVLCFNHHDYMIAAGSRATKWLERLIDSGVG